ncbi:MerR family transcriptional regulator [Paracoccus luteus]|uniref:MerR family transcriptional regulator n=1 Tax=Paracoccus luteus TaxID=2508543 RepID=UPI00106FE025|nr:MerR family transcriptional regulator [Paracoccus luteus]
MAKSPQAFRTIGEVARAVGVATHVLRYWETQFPQLAPVKRADGRRYYRPEDVQLAAGLCEVLREEGLTIRGARRLIAPDRGAALRARGALRLDETAADTVADADAVPGQAEPQSADADPSETVARPSAGGKGGQPGTWALPLFPDLDGADGDATAGVLLDRLALTAAALRGRQAPLPDQARDLARRLRDCHDRMRTGQPAA